MEQHSQPDENGSSMLECDLEPKSRVVLQQKKTWAARCQKQEEAAADVEPPGFCFPAVCDDAVLVSSGKPFKNAHRSLSDQTAPVSPVSNPPLSLLCNCEAGLSQRHLCMGTTSSSWKWLRTVFEDKFEDLNFTQHTGSSVGCSSV